MEFPLADEVRVTNNPPYDDLHSVHQPVCGLNKLQFPVVYHAHVQLADLGLVVDPLLTGDVLVVDHLLAGHVFVTTSHAHGVCGVLIPVSFNPVASLRPGPPCFRH